MKTTIEQREIIISKIDVLTETLNTKKDIVNSPDANNLDEYQNLLVKEYLYIDIYLIELQINTLKEILIKDELNY